MVVTGDDEAMDGVLRRVFLLPCTEVGLMT